MENGPRGIIKWHIRITIADTNIQGRKSKSVLRGAQQNRQVEGRKCLLVLIVHIKF